MIYIIATAIYFFGLLWYWGFIYTPISDLFMRLTGNTPGNKKARKNMLILGLLWPITLPLNFSKFKSLYLQAEMAKRVGKSKSEPKIVPQEDERWNRKM